MTYDDIQCVWGSPHNQPSHGELEQQKQRLALRLRRRYRGFVLITGLAATWLTVLGVGFARHVANGGAFDLSREWAAALLFLLPIVALGVFWRQRFHHRSRHVLYQQSIVASVRALLDENRLSRTRLKLIAALNGVMLLVMPFIVVQLRAAGKAGDEILRPAFVLFPALMVLVFVVLALRYRRTLLPQKLELETLLKSYE